MLDSDLHSFDIGFYNWEKLLQIIFSVAGGDRIPCYTMNGFKERCSEHMGHDPHWYNSLCFAPFTMAGFSCHRVSLDDTSCKVFCLKISEHFSTLPHSKCNIWIFYLEHALAFQFHWPMYFVTEWHSIESWPNPRSESTFFMNNPAFFFPDTSAVTPTNPLHQCSGVLGVDSLKRTRALHFDTLLLSV